MKKSITFSVILIALLFGSFTLSAQSISIPGGTINIGPVLMGTTSADGAHSFSITGSGYNPNEAIYADVEAGYYPRFKISLTGGSGTYMESISFNADGSGNVSQTIYVNYSPEVIGLVDASIEIYEFQTFVWNYQDVRGIGSGPEILLEGRPSGSDPWDEIADGSVTPSTSEGTDFGQALANSGIVDRTFRITNTKAGGLSGNLVLDEYATSKYVELSGTNADQFSVIAEPSTPVSPLGTTTYTVRFQPTSAGVKTATISIGNNDPDEDPYDYAITGEGIVVLPDPPTANAATNINQISFTANWTVGGGGTTNGYYLDVATDNSFTSFVSGYENKDVGLVTSHAVNGLAANTAYYYRVRAYNEGGSSGNSGTITLTTAPSVPTAMSPSNISLSNFYANWGFVSGATSYRLDVNTQSDFLGTAILDDVTVTTTFKNVTGLTAGTTYFYRVRSYNGNASENSGVVAAVTLCNSPIAAAATDLTDVSFTANWSAPSGGAPDYYRLDVSISNTFNSFVFGYEDLTVYGTSQAVSGLTENTTYYYRVRAVNVSGTSTNSNVITVLTYAGASTTWTGTVSTAWGTAGNWDNGIPYSSTDVTIPSTSNQPVVSSNAFCGNLTLESQAQLKINSGVSMAVSGDLLAEADASGAASIVEFGGLSVSGTSNVEQYLTESRWHYVSPPVSDETANVFYDIYLRYYDEPSSSFVYIEEISTPLTAGVGYTAWSSPTWFGTTTVNYSGTLNSGAVNIPVSNSGSGWNLGGNPYPSAVDWDDASWTKTNLDASVYVWDGVQYLTWNGIVGTLTDGIIPASQSFFVKANAASPALQVNNAARTHGVSAYKSSGVENLIEIQASGNGYDDVTFIHFDEESSTGIDSQFDTYKLFGINEAPQIFSIVGNENLSINTLPEYYAGMTIPIGFKAEYDGEYTIRVSNLQSFDVPVNIVIEDMFTGELVEVLGETEISFLASSDDDVNRFMLHFMMLTDVTDKSLNADMSIYTNQKSVYVRTLAPIENGQISVYDLSGQKILEEDLSYSTFNKVNIQAESGYYIVKVLSNEGFTTEKVYLK